MVLYPLWFKRTWSKPYSSFSLNKTEFFNLLLLSVQSQEQVNAGVLLTTQCPGGDLPTLVEVSLIPARRVCSWAWSPPGFPSDEFVLSAAWLVSGSCLLGLYFFFSYLGNMS